jgi:hypothetical protein
MPPAVQQLVGHFRQRMGEMVEQRSGKLERRASPATTVAVTVNRPLASRRAFV